MNPFPSPFPKHETPLCEDPACSCTMPSRYYTDPAVYEREKQAIFARTWHYVGHESQLRGPGDYLTLDLADESVFVMRGEDGPLRGFFNVCRHCAHRLLEGAGNVRSIAWTCRRGGRLRHARFADRTGGFDPGTFRLPRVQVEAMHGFVFVNLDTSAPSIAESAGGLAADLAAFVPRLADLEPVESFAFDSPQGAEWRANWKVVVDNYVECYHCGNAHPALSDLMVMGSYEHRVQERWSRQISHESRPGNAAYAFTPEAEVRIAAFWYLWPTTSIWLMPGAANLYVLAMMPSGHDATRFSGHRYALEARRDEARSVYLNTILGPEDQGLCESVQRGLQSRSYDQGRFMVDPERSGTGEHGVHRFHRLVMEALDPPA